MFHMLKCTFLNNIRSGYQNKEMENKRAWKWRKERLINNDILFQNNNNVLT